VVADAANRTTTRAATSIGSDADDVEGGGISRVETADGGNVVGVAARAAADEASTDVLVKKASKKLRQVCRNLPLICT